MPSDERLGITVGHGIDVCVIQMDDGHPARSLTPTQAERLGVRLIQQAAYARAAVTVGREGQDREVGG